MPGVLMTWDVGNAAAVAWFDPGRTSQSVSSRAITAAVIWHKGKPLTLMEVRGSGKTDKNGSPTNSLPFMMQTRGCGEILRCFSHTDCCRPRPRHHTPTNIWGGVPEPCKMMPNILTRYHKHKAYETRIDPTTPSSR